MNTSHDLIPMFLERGVYNLSLEMKVPVQESRTGAWGTSGSHAWSVVGAISNCKMLEKGDDTW